MVPRDEHHQVRRDAVRVAETLQELRLQGRERHGLAVLRRVHVGRRDASGEHLVATVESMFQERADDRLHRGDARALDAAEAHARRTFRPVRRRPAVWIDDAAGTVEDGTARVPLAADGRAHRVAVTLGRRA